MKTTLQFLLFMLLALAVIVLAILLGDLGAWYFADRKSTRLNSSHR